MLLIIQYNYVSHDISHNTKLVAQHNLYMTQIPVTHHNYLLHYTITFNTTQLPVTRHNYLLHDTITFYMSQLPVVWR
jgi:hypothetical protein